MAISIISNPETVNTVNNPNVWVINSTNKNQPGFKYVVVLKNAITNTVLKTIEVPTRPIDNYGEFNLSKTLSEYLETNINIQDIYTNNYTTVDGWRIRYRLEISEKYLTNWAYSDTEYVNMLETKCVTFTPSVHPFQVGDSVVVTPTNPLIRPDFQGLYNVIALEAVTNFPIFNTPWVNTPLNPGTIKFADNRLTTTPALLTTFQFEVWNATINFDEWPTINLNTFYPSMVPIATVITNEFFTNFKEKFTINYGQDIFIPLPNKTGNNLKVEFIRDDLSVFSYSIPSLPSTTNITTFINLTPRNAITGGFLFDPTMKYFDVKITNPQGTTKLTNTFRYYVNFETCKTSNIEILFEDRKGSFGSFTFDARHTTDLSITKEKYNKNIEYTNSTYDLNTASGTSIINVDFDRDITLRTREIKNRLQDLYFEELLISKNTFIKIDGIYQRVDVLETNGKFLQTNESGIRRREIKVRLSNKI